MFGKVCLFAALFVVLRAELCTIQLIFGENAMDLTHNSCDACAGGSHFVTLQHEPQDGAQFEQKYNFLFCGDTPTVADVESALVMTNMCLLALSSFLRLYMYDGFCVSGKRSWLRNVRQLRGWARVCGGISGRGRRRGRRAAVQPLLAWGLGLFR